MADTTWLTATDPTLATDVRVSFPTPTGSPTTGAGLQTFRALLRKTAGSADPTVNIELWETGGGSAIATLVSGVSITSLTGQVVEATFDASSLGTANGSAVECRIVTTVGVG